MKKLKSVLPSLREKKRYLIYKVLSQQSLPYTVIKPSLLQSISQFIGDVGMAESGVQFIDEAHDLSAQSGIIRINHKYLDKIRASFCGTPSLNSVPVIVRSVSASGMINKITEQCTPSAG